MKLHYILLILIPVLILAMGTLLYEGFNAKSDLPLLTNSSVSEYFESIRTDPNELRMFFHAMPKGGDIHNHLTGAVYAEDIIDIAARHGLFVDPGIGQLYANNTSNGLVPVSSAYNNVVLYWNLVDDWSMRDYPSGNGSATLHFFRIFSLIDPVTRYEGELIASLRNRAAEEHVSYIETMVQVPSTQKEVRDIESRVSWNDTFSVMRQNLLDAGLRDICRKNAGQIDKDDAESLKLCSPAGKEVTMRYLYASSRLNPKLVVFTELVQAFETANQSSLVVGINSMGPDFSYYDRTDYLLDMNMIAYLHSVYPDVKIAMHAGEQTMGTVPPEDLRSHLSDAINVAHADRLGHGMDIVFEHEAETTLTRMAEQDIPIEILLTSNAQLFQISGLKHPVSVYIRHHVPIILATDDPGIERTDLTEQYVLFASQHPDISYDQIRTIVQNSIRYSFLPELEKQEMLGRLNESLGRFEKTVVNQTAFGR